MKYSKRMWAWLRRNPEHIHGIATLNLWETVRRFQPHRPFGLIDAARHRASRSLLDMMYQE